MLLQETLNIDLNDEHFFSDDLGRSSKEKTQPITFLDKSADEIIIEVANRIRKVMGWSPNIG